MPQGPRSQGQEGSCQGLVLTESSGISLEVTFQGARNPIASMEKRIEESRDHKDTRVISLEYAYLRQLGKNKQTKYIYVCVYIYMCVYIYTYIHTHTYACMYVCTVFADFSEKNVKIPRNTHK